MMKRILLGTAALAAALIFAWSAATGVTRAAEASAPAAQSSQAPPAEGSGASPPMMRWHGRSGQMPMGPGMGPDPCAGVAMGMMSSDPKLRAQMMQVQGEMMKKMGELMEQRAKELQSGK